MNFEADKSLMDAVRDIAALIEKHRDEAERERRLSKTCLGCIARDRKADLLLGNTHAMSSAVEAVELACRLAGTTSIRTSSPLERCFRDIQTMRHHVFAPEARYGTFGQVYLGVEPDFEVVAFD